MARVSKRQKWIAGGVLGAALLLVLLLWILGTFRTKKCGGDPSGGGLKLTGPGILYKDASGKVKIRHLVGGETGDHIFGASLSSDGMWVPCKDLNCPGETDNPFYDSGQITVLDINRGDFPSAAIVRPGGRYLFSSGSWWYHEPGKALVSVNQPFPVTEVHGVEVSY
jgi:hypothetical protein